jgi:CBS domain-containing protein
MSERHMLDIIRDQKPVMLPPTATVKEACGRMKDRRVGAVLVVEEGSRLVGIFTGRDAICRVLAQGKNAAHTHLSEVMTPKPSCMPPGRTAIEALRLMQDGGFRHIPVTEGGRVVGIVSRGDFRGLEQARLDDETHIFERLW